MYRDGTGQAELERVLSAPIDTGPGAAGNAGGVMELHAENSVEQRKSYAEATRSGSPGKTRGVDDNMWLMTTWKDLDS